MTTAVESTVGERRGLEGVLRLMEILVAEEEGDGGLRVVRE